MTAASCIEGSTNYADPHCHNTLWSVIILIRNRRPSLILPSRSRALRLLLYHTRVSSKAQQPISQHSFFFLIPSSLLLFAVWWRSPYLFRGLRKFRALCLPTTHRESLVFSLPIEPFVSERALFQQRLNVALHELIFPLSSYNWSDCPSPTYAMSNPPLSGHSTLPTLTRNDDLRLVIIFELSPSQRFSSRYCVASALALATHFFSAPATQLSILTQPLRLHVFALCPRHITFSSLITLRSPRTHFSTVMPSLCLPPPHLTWGSLLYTAHSR